MNARDFDDVPRDLSECDHDERYYIEVLLPNYRDDEWVPVRYYEIDADAILYADQRQDYENTEYVGYAWHTDRVPLLYYMLYRVYDTETNTVVWPAKMTA